MDFVDLDSWLLFTIRVLIGARTFCSLLLSHVRVGVAFFAVAVAAMLLGCCHGC